MIRHLPFAAVLTLLATSGCLERREEILVRADGSLEVTHRFKGDPGEFGDDRPDALPRGAPWTVRDEDVRVDDSRTDRVRVATATFARAADVPATFGAAGDPAPLAMRTQVSVQRRPDGTSRWIFERRYGARSYAVRDRLFRRTFPGDVRKALERGEPIEGELLEKAVQAVVEFERSKVGLLLEQAIQATAPDRATAANLLAARRDVERALEADWTAEAVRDLIGGSAEEKLAVEERFRNESARSAAAAGARALGDPAVEARLAEAFERARRVWDATEGLQDETFELRVTFPAPVVLSDAAALEDGGRTAVFRFGGEDLRDHDLVLRAVAEGP